MGVLSPDCYACRGVGYVKPGFGVGAPGIGAYGAPGIAPPLGGGMYPLLYNLLMALMVLMEHMHLLLIILLLCLHPLTYFKRIY